MSLRTSNVIYQAPIVTSVPEVPSAGRCLGPIARTDGYFMKDESGALLKIGPPLFYRRSALLNQATTTTNTWVVMETWANALDSDFKRGDWFLQATFAMFHSAASGNGEIRIHFAGSHNKTLRSVPWNANEGTRSTEHRNQTVWNSPVTFSTDGAADVRLEVNNFVAGTATLRTMQFLLYQVTSTI